MKKLLLLAMLLPAVIQAQTSGVAYRLRGGVAAPPATCRATAPVDLYFRTSTDALYVCTAANVWTIGFTAGGAAGGDVVGPASATDNAIVRFNLTTGKLVQNSAVTIADTTGDVTTPGVYKAGDGSVSSASFQFGTEATLGFFRLGAGQLGVTSGSSTVGWFDATGWHGFGTAVETFNDSSTSADGVILTTNGNATVGVQKFSPRLRFSGSGWKTDATAAARMTDWIVENQPVQGTADPSANLVFSSQINNGGYTPRVTFKSGGGVDATGAITQTSNSSTAFESGPNGGTNPVFRLVNSTASQADGVSITGAAAGTGTTFQAISSGATSNLILRPKGDASIVLAGTGVTGASSGGVWARWLSGPGLTQFFINRAGTGTVYLDGTMMMVGSAGVYAMNSTVDAGLSGAADTGLSRISAGVIGIGTGVAGNTSGSISLAAGTFSSGLGLFSGAPTANRFINASTTLDGQAISRLTNLSNGINAQAQYEIFNDAGSQFQFGLNSSTRTAYGALLAGEGFLYGTSSMTLMSDAGAGVIKFAAGGNVEQFGVAAGKFTTLAGAQLYSSGTPGIAGNGTLNTNSKDSAGKVTTNATGASTIVLTFANAFTRAPACSSTNETTANLIRAICTTTTLTLNGTIVSGDVISYSALGY